MYDMETRRSTLALVAQGRSLNSVSRQTGVSRAAIRAWQARVEPLPRMARECPSGPADDASYAYLFGLYLGDGCISTYSRGGYCLRIACADAWPGLIELCRAAVPAVRPGACVALVQKQGCVMVSSYDRHWPCLFPQHGPGRKHERPIVLADWQRKIVDTHRWEFVRGLIHSDGCRTTNWTTRTVAGVTKRYEYPRYFFTNRSADILRLFTDTLDTLGVAWRKANAQNISVARKASVALMDAHVGPKY
ncbi:helix-turn-helix domain-containing protein [Streptomyces sp. NBC_01725]|uniref:helix-turn-helix domain-containing protein n=1 Tax=Streptomyces sp. NBC_01725 TaxID=2975923 RepID=UPI002E29BD6D|nr:helix-turn-helix domain-containing protein [Streptomyces sp. NBC_01725]